MCARVADRGAGRPGNAGASAASRARCRLVLPPASAVPSGVYPSRRVSRPQPKASEIANVIVFLKDPPRRAEPAPMHATITQKDEAFVPARRRDHPRLDHRLSELRSVLPQRLLAVARRQLRSRPLSEGRIERPPVPERGPGQGLLPHPLAHDGEHHGLRPPVFPHSRPPTAPSPWTTCRRGATRSARGTSGSARARAPIKVEAGRTARVEFALPMDTTDDRPPLRPAAPGRPHLGRDVRGRGDRADRRAAADRDPGQRLRPRHGDRQARGRAAHAVGARAAPVARAAGAGRRCSPRARR